jgi:hypothetical protein
MNSPTQYPRVCRGGHLIGGPHDEREGRCRVCRIRSKRRYELSPKGREAQERYEASRKGQLRRDRYEASTKGIVRRLRFDLRQAHAAALTNGEINRNGIGRREHEEPMIR